MKSHDSLVHGYTRRRGSSSSSRPLARVVPPDLDVDARRSHRTDRDDPRASRESSLAPPSPFSLCFVFISETISSHRATHSGVGNGGLRLSDRPLSPRQLVILTPPSRARAVSRDRRRRRRQIARSKLSLSLVLRSTRVSSLFSETKGGRPRVDRETTSQKT